MLRPRLFLYQDFRAYLRDMFEFFKTSEPGFSHRVFARRAGFGAPNFLHLLIKGKRDVSAKALDKIGLAFQLSSDEVAFLKKLSKFNQSKLSYEKADAFKDLYRNSTFQRAGRVHKSQFKYYSKWHHSIIRELVTLKSFKEDTKWISKKLRGKVSVREVASSLQFLLKFGFLKRDGTGRLIQSEPTLESGEEVRSLAIKQFHQQMLQKASEALEERSARERDISSITLGVPKELMKEFKSKIIAFRKDLLETIGGAGYATDDIVQINIQCFSMLDTEGEI